VGYQCIYNAKIDYVKISCKEDVHICRTNFTKNIEQIRMKQLAGAKCMENECFMKTLKFEMQEYMYH
jgi:hypothetical protein